MCGIAGWLAAPGSQPPPQLLERMSEAIRHRGPDDEGVFLDAARGVGLAFRRLSIIDLSAASHQPMVDEDSGATLVFNGELYNFVALRTELEALGHRFRSRGDAEVVLRSFLQWGVAAFERFAGMFALALWDRRCNRLHLARDPMGMKPLYYASRGGNFAFASELKALRNVPGLPFELSQPGVVQYLEFGYVFDEHRTIIEGISKLPPGCRMEIEPGQPGRIVTYFTPPTPVAGDLRGEAQRVDELESVLGTVAAEHTVADVPVGLLLSGGLDSSVVAALAARRGPLTTISMGFTGSGIDERPQARLVAEHVGSRHLELAISPAQVMAEVEAGAWVFDDLFADWGTITTRLMYRQCREHGIKVVLVGEGADELFGGYGIFETAPKLNAWQRFRLYQRYCGRRHGRLFRQFDRILGDYARIGGGDAFEAIRLFESRRQLPNQYVMKVDKASMAESVEARAPYLDRRVAELAYRTPREWLQRDGQNKYLLRALGARNGLLPVAIASRAKFGAPLAASWMDEDAVFRTFARGRIVEGAWARRLGLQPAMRAYFDEGREGYAFPRGISLFRNLAWRLLLLELWAGHYLQERAA